jgi:anthranilate synthase component 1
MIFALFRYVIHLNHFNDIMTIIEYIPEGESSTIGQLKVQIQNTRNNGFPFYTTGATETNITDETFIDMVQKAKYHCRRGDVFQMVLARRFSVSFKGDEFNVYRALRRINPSPYLYFFDYGNFRIFGSSPESQLKISNGKATLNPIAGTYRRTGNDIADKALAEKLSEDPKENAEHAMLVDLARNDLSRSCTNVKVETYKEVQFFSHVIHLVSKVTGKLKTHINPMKVIADTFPAGTLSGAPKHRAMQLIDQYENQSRGFYGGAVGFIGFNGDVNLAILIRSFLSKNNKLFFQAGAGIVNSSDEVSELQEVNNKLAALHKAIEEVDGNRKLTK